MTQKELQAEFIKTYTEYSLKSYALILTLFNNLNPILPSDQAEVINDLFHSVTNSMEKLQTVSEELKKQPSFPVAVAN